MNGAEIEAQWLAAVAAAIADYEGARGAHPTDLEAARQWMTGAWDGGRADEVRDWLESGVREARHADQMSRAGAGPASVRFTPWATDEQVGDFCAAWTDLPDDEALRLVRGPDGAWALFVPGDPAVLASGRAGRDEYGAWQRPHVEDYAEARWQALQRGIAARQASRREVAR